MSRNAVINSSHHLHTLKATAEDAEAITQRLEQDSDFQVLQMPEHIEQRGERSQTVIPVQNSTEPTSA